MVAKKMEILAEGLINSTWSYLPAIDIQYSCGLDETQQLSVILPAGWSATHTAPSKIRAGQVCVTVADVVETEGNCSICGNYFLPSAYETEYSPDDLSGSTTSVILNSLENFSIICDSGRGIDLDAVSAGTAVSIAAQLANNVEAKQIFVYSDLNGDIIRVGSPFSGNEPPYMSKSVQKKERKYEYCKCCKTSVIAEDKKVVVSPNTGALTAPYDPEDPPKLTQKWTTGSTVLKTLTKGGRYSFRILRDEFEGFNIQVPLAPGSAEDDCLCYVCKTSKRNSEYTYSATFKVGSSIYTYKPVISCQFEFYILIAPYEKIKDIPVFPYEFSCSDIQVYGGGAEFTGDETQEEINEKFWSNRQTISTSLFADVVDVCNWFNDFFSENHFVQTSVVHLIPKNIHILYSWSSSTTRYNPNIVYNEKCRQEKEREIQTVFTPYSTKSFFEEAKYWYLMAKRARGTNTGITFSTIDNKKYLSFYFDIDDTNPVVFSEDFSPAEAYSSSDWGTTYNGPYKDEAEQQARFIGADSNAESTNEWKNVEPFEPGHTTDELQLINANFGSSIIALGMYGTAIIPIPSPTSGTKVDLSDAASTIPMEVRAVAPKSETYEWGDTSAKGQKLLTISSGLWVSNGETSKEDLLALANKKDGTTTETYSCPLSYFSTWASLFSVSFGGNAPCGFSFSVLNDTVNYTVKKPTNN